MEKIKTFGGRFLVTVNGQQEKYMTFQFSGFNSLADVLNFIVSSKNKTKELIGQSYLPGTFENIGIEGTGNAYMKFYGSSDVLEAGAGSQLGKRVPLYEELIIFEDNLDAWLNLSRASIKTDYIVQEFRLVNKVDTFM